MMTHSLGTVNVPVVWMPLPIWKKIGLGGAVVVVVGGQAFNVILGVFEPGIQGARLIFVEHFSKYYSGNGRPFRPFGAARTHTISSVSEDGTMPVGPILRGPST